MSDVLLISLPIVLGFVLTTVFGGWWAQHLQRESWKQQNNLQNKEWDRQNDLRKQEDEHHRAAIACENLSKLLDKRLYRMLRLFYAIEDYGPDPTDVSRLDARLSDYNEVLYEWNDSLNVNLALLGSHFGASAREYLYYLQGYFQRVGKDLQEAIRGARRGKDVSVELNALRPEFQGHAGSLNDRVYQLGLAMMTQLRDDTVGSKVNDKLEAPNLERLMPSGNEGS